MKYCLTTFFSSVDKPQFEYSILDYFVFIVFRSNGLISNSINLVWHKIEYKIDQQLLSTRSNLPNLQHCIAKSGVGHGSRKFIVLSKFSVNWLNASRKVQPIYGMFCRSNSPPSAMRGRYTACWIIPSQFKFTNSYTQIILFWLTSLKFFQVFLMFQFVRSTCRLPLF